MKVALVHDYLKEFGGAERVLEVLHEMWPEAPIYTAFKMPEKWGPHGERLAKWDIRTTWMQGLLWKDQLTSHYSILGPMAFESLDLSEYDVIINSTNPYVSKAIITHPGQLHIAYIHTPPKAPWGYEGTSAARQNIFWKPFVKIADHYLRQADYLAAQRVDVLVANSETVKERIEKFYRRESRVIYPPVDINSKLQITNDKQIQNSKFKIQNDDLTLNSKLETRNYYLMGGRLVGRKDLELPIMAAKELGFDLKVFGKGMGMGSAEENLRKEAHGNSGTPSFARASEGQAGLNGRIEFLGEVSDLELRELYAGAKAYIDPRPDEDFGIMPIEAMAAGTPVIARASGGFVETVKDGKTGVLFEESFDSAQDYKVKSLVEAIKRFEGLKIKAEDCVKQAEKFGRERFEKEMFQLIESEWKRIKSK